MACGECDECLGAAEDDAEAAAVRDLEESRVPYEWLEPRRPPRPRTWAERLLDTETDPTRRLLLLLRPTRLNAVVGWCFDLAARLGNYADQDEAVAAQDYERWPIRSRLAWWVGAKIQDLDELWTMRRRFWR